MTAGAELLDELYATLTRYVVFPSEPTWQACSGSDGPCSGSSFAIRYTQKAPLTSTNAPPDGVCSACSACSAWGAWSVSAVAVTLWVAATHAQDAWEHATRLVIKSPLKRCGKSRLLDLIAELAHNVLMTVNISVAALVRTISEKDPPTILVDEADTIFAQRRGQRSETSEDLRGILNAGHQRGRPYIRWDINNRKLEECPTFAMAALAGIGDMPDTIEDRAVIVTMRRRATTESVVPLRRRRDIPILCSLRDRLHAWAQDKIHIIEEIEPIMPVEDRAADTWESLVTIADVVGGHWPDLAREVCKIMTSQTATDEGTLGERLLADLRGVFGDQESLWTSTIIDSLVELDEAPWASYRDKRKDPRITSREIAYLLRVYAIRSEDVRIAKQVRKGYLREHFVDAWTRYLEPLDTDKNAADPAPRTTPATSATSATNNDQSNVSAGQEPDSSVADRDSSNATEAPDPLHGGQVFADTAAWDAAGRPGLTADPQPTHRCDKCGKTSRPPRMVAVYPHSGCGGLWTAIT